MKNRLYVVVYCTTASDDYDDDEFNTIAGVYDNAYQAAEAAEVLYMSVIDHKNCAHYKDAISERYDGKELEKLDLFEEYQGRDVSVIRIIPVSLGQFNSDLLLYKKAH